MISCSRRRSPITGLAFAPPGAEPVLATSAMDGRVKSLRREFGLKLIQTWLALAYGLCGTRVDRAGKARGLVSKFRVIPHAL